MKRIYENTENQPINERVARLEAGLIVVCDAINEIKNNHLAHVNSKLDSLDEKIDNIDKRVESIAVKMGIVFAVITVVGQSLISHFLN